MGQDKVPSSCPKMCQPQFYVFKHVKVSLFENSTQGLFIPEFFCHTAMIEKQNYLPGMTRREARRQEKLNDAKKSDASEKACGC